jgi:uncharacterized protein YoxC
MPVMEIMNLSSGLAMGRHAGNSLAAWQLDPINSINTKLLMFFVALAAVALATQALVFVIMGIGAMKAQKKVMAIVEEVHGKAMPVLLKSHVLLEELTPKIQEIAANVQRISTVVREKVEEFEPTVSATNVSLLRANETFQDANSKARAQITRVDGMVTSLLTSVAEIAGTVQHSIRVPVREVAAVVSGVKAGIDVLLERWHFVRSSLASRAVPAYPARPQAQTPAPRDPEFVAMQADRRDMGL